MSNLTLPVNPRYDTVIVHKPFVTDMVWLVNLKVAPTLAGEWAYAEDGTFREESGGFSGTHKDLVKYVADLHAASAIHCFTAFEANLVPSTIGSALTFLHIPELDRNEDNDNTIYGPDINLHLRMMRHSNRFDACLFKGVQTIRYFNAEEKFVGGIACVRAGEEESV